MYRSSYYQYEEEKKPTKEYDPDCKVCECAMEYPCHLPCKHTLCSSCVKDHFEKHGMECPVCSKKLGADFSISQNVDYKLGNALKEQFPYRFYVPKYAYKTKSYVRWAS